MFFFERDAKLCGILSNENPRNANYQLSKCAASPILLWKNLDSNALFFLERC